MERADENRTGKSFVFWVSHSLKCLSFHPDSRFEAIDFSDYSAMWQMVHEFVQKGYAVQ